MSENKIDDKIKFKWSKGKLDFPEYRQFKRERYIVCFMRKEGNGYRRLKKRRISSHAKYVRFSKNNIHPIDLTKYTYRLGHKKYYCFDVDKIGKKKGGQMNFEGNDLDYDPEELAFIKTGIVKDLTATLHAKLIDSNSIFLMVICAIAGIFGGIFIAGFF